MKFIDSLLNKITMYRLMLYYLSVLYGAAIVFSFFKILPYNPLDIITSGLYLIAACFLFNQLFARIFRVKPNYESQYITGTILALIVGPLPLLPNIGFMTLAAVVAMGSKYLIAINKQHIFNPTAFAVVTTALFLNQGASWWVGDKALLPFILLGGLLILRKTSRSNMVLGFLLSFGAFLLLFNFNKTTLGDIPYLLADTLLSPATLFFAFVMLTEPITSPAHKKMRLYFGIFAGVILVIYQTFLGVFYTTELALLTANLLGRIVHFSTKYRLVLKEKKEIGAGIWEFLFTPDKPITFIAGQFMEWTLSHPHPDTRGTRRYFSISSSPTEKEVMLATKIPEKPSSYKASLMNLNPGDALYATNLEGEFVLPLPVIPTKSNVIPAAVEGSRPTIKLKTAAYIFIAGGIGITPFRSIIKYLLDNNISVPITLFYVAHSKDEFVFDDLFEQAQKAIGLKLIQTTERLTEDLIKQHVEKPSSKTFYLSGPQPMIMAYKEMLEKMGIKKSNIKTDYFPGYEAI